MTQDTAKKIQSMISMLKYYQSEKKEEEMLKIIIFIDGYTKAILKANK